MPRFSDVGIFNNFLSKILAAEVVFDDVQRKGASYFKFQGVEKTYVVSLI